MREREPTSVDGQPPFKGPWQDIHPVRKPQPAGVWRWIAVWAVAGLVWLGVMMWLGPKVVAGWRLS